MTNPFKGIVDDTLKKEEKGKLRFARTSCTMASAWFVGIGSYIIDQYNNGFRYEAWLLLIGVATGVKQLDAWSERTKAKKENEEAKLQD